MAFPDDPAGRYAAASDGFTALVVATIDWDAPAPVEGWTARDVVWHLADWVPAVMLDGAGVDLPRRDPVAPDPATDWARFDEAMRATLSRADFATAQFAHPQAGSMSLAQAVDMLVTPDVFMHSWDLARATGQHIELDPDYSAVLLAGMEAFEEPIRASGHYGQRVDAADDADVPTRLIAFIGRDPQWLPPRAQDA